MSTEHKEHKNKESKSKCIGLDLGTTYSCVSIFRNNQTEVIANSLGNRTTPSYVAFTDSEILVGAAAKNQQSFNPENTIYSIKRIIGLPFDDVKVQEEINLIPFEVD